MDFQGDEDSRLREAVDVLYSHQIPRRQKAKQEKIYLNKKVIIALLNISDFFSLNTVQLPSKYFSQQKLQEDNQKFISNTLFVNSLRTQRWKHAWLKLGEQYIWKQFKYFQFTVFTHPALVLGFELTNEKSLFHQSKSFNTTWNYLWEICQTKLLKTLGTTFWYYR